MLHKLHVTQVTCYTGYMLHRLHVTLVTCMLHGLHVTQVRCVTQVALVSYYSKQAALL